MEGHVTHGVEPEEVGMDRRTLSSAARIAASRRGTGRLTVLRHGHVVLDYRWGREPGDLYWVFSASKPVVAVLTHQLADDGAVSLDDPVARHWPGFAAAGKSEITIRQVLSHRTALPTIRSAVRGGALSDVSTMLDWDATIRRIAAARPRGRPGAYPAYGYLDFGFILGEVLRRVTGEPFAELARRRIFEPLGMRDSWFGLPAEEEDRVVPLAGSGPVSRLVARSVNRPAVRAAVIPAGGLTTTTTDLARFYEALRRGGALEGTRILSEAGVGELVRPSDRGQYDRFVHLNVRYGQGVQLGGPRRDVLGWGPFGRDSSPRAFGHNGSNVAIGWTDPDSAITLVHVTGFQTSYLRDFAHLAEVADAVLASARVTGGGH